MWSICSNLSYFLKKRKNVKKEWPIDDGGSEVKVAQSTLCDPIDCTVHSILPAWILECIAFLFSRGSSQPRDQTQVSSITGGFSTSWATGEAQEYWSGWPSLLQGIFPTQESNWGLLHCRQILYQLSYQGSSQNPTHPLKHSLMAQEDSLMSLAGSASFHWKTSPGTCSLGSTGYSSLH